MSLFKNFMMKGRKGTLGGIETNHKSLLKGLKERGHVIIENKAFPKGISPDLIICPTYGPVSLLSIWYYKRKYNCACVQHAHTTQDDMKGGFLPDALVPYAGIYLRHLYKFSEIIITPSNFSKQNLKTLNIPTRPSIIPVSNGVNLNKFKRDSSKREAFRDYLHKEFNISREKVVILCVGVLWERKGLDVFHDIAKVFPEHEFIWVGNYITEKALKEKYDDLPNLTFTGFVDDIVAAYCGADVFFFPSRAENQGIPLLEAAACELPILCRDLPTYDWLEHDVHCLKGKSIADFKRYLRILVKDDELRKKLSNRALENVKEHDINRIIDQVEKIYKRAVKIKKKLIGIEIGRKNMKFPKQQS
ncbi:MAG: glycosyltransferase family 4 protein [Promethearchaeota archaeon]